MIAPKMEKRSVFGWEDSYFGGYERVAYDHPFIYVPKQIDFDMPKGKDADFYVGRKVCQLFLLKVAKFKLESALSAGCIKSTVKRWFTKVNVVVFSKTSVTACVKHIIDRDTEMGNLFKHYSSLITSTKFFYELPADSKEKKQDDGGDDGDAGGVSGSGGGEMSEDELKKMREMMAKVSSYNPSSVYKPQDAISGDLKKKTEFKIQTKHAPTVYLQRIDTEANRLVSMLDISFDPKEDKIENLKAGKMSSHKIAEIPAGNTHVYYRTEEAVSTRPFSICILADESGSMVYSGCWTKQHDLIKILYRAFSQILPQDKIYIYGHSGLENPEIYIYNEKYNPVFDQVIDNQQRKGRYKENYDGPVIENIYERVRQQTSDNIIFISISDGEPAGHGYGGLPAINDLKRVIEKCKRDGFVTVGVGLRFGMVKEIYSYHTIVDDMSKLVKNVSGLINRVVKTEFKD